MSAEGPKNDSDLEKKKEALHDAFGSSGGENVDVSSDFESDIENVDSSQNEEAAAAARERLRKMILSGQELENEESGPEVKSTGTLSKNGRVILPKQTGEE